MKAKNMKKWMAAAVVLMLCTVSLTFAQQGNRRNMDPKEMAKQTVSDLIKRLNLDQSQQDSVYQYQLAHNEEMGKAFTNALRADRNAMRTKMTELQANTDKKIMSILNDAQKEMYKKVQAERQRNGSGTPRNGGRSSSGSRGGSGGY